MKNLIFFLFVFTFVSGTLFATSLGRTLKYDTLSTLKIKGKIMNAGENESTCMIELLSGNKVLDTLVLNKRNKSFNFNLLANKSYALRITQEGFVTRLVSLDTRCPSEIVDDFSFRFNTTLLSEADAEKLNKDALDFPIAIIHFDNKNEDFTYNREYTSQIKREIVTVQAGSTASLVHKD